MSRLPASIRWSIFLVLAGLVVEIGSLFALHHALGFMTFLTVGCTLIGLGMLFFLYFLLRDRNSEAL